MNDYIEYIEECHAEDELTKCEDIERLAHELNSIRGICMNQKRRRKEQEEKERRESAF